MKSLKVWKKRGRIMAGSQQREEQIARFEQYLHELAEQYTRLLARRAKLEEQLRALEQKQEKVLARRLELQQLIEHLRQQ